jgi:transcriptional regulator with XRE-family HTH domain
MTPQEFKKWRREQGWSQVEAARRLGFASGAVQISRLENGHRPITRAVELACKYLAAQPRE